MDYINKYLRNFKPYKLASHEIWSVSAKQRDKVLKLDWNESTLPPSPNVLVKIRALLDDPNFFNLYPSTYNAHLIDLLADYTKLPKENIQYFASSDSLHEYIAKLFINVGDPVLILGPSYDNFRLTCQVNGGNIFFYEYNADFSFNEEGFEQFIEKINPSLIYICNPNNPTGYLHDIAYIKKLIEKFSNTMFLLDEAYIEFAGDNASCAGLVVDHENLLVSRTMSKAFALANFRFGYLLAHVKNINYISTIRNPKNITTFAQVAAEAVLDDVEYMRNYVSVVIEAREYFISSIKKKLTKLHPYSSRGNFVLIKCTSYDEKEKIVEFLKTFNIYVRDVNQSPLVKECFRVSIGTKQQMERVLKSLESYYKDAK